jgi:hypothetical protein
VNERQWVESLIKPLRKALNRSDRQVIEVRTSQRLRYTSQVYEYQGDEPSSLDAQLYETDLLFCDLLPEGRWIPRVVVECKLKTINTHESLAYSAKAATHKNVHPYLRYGMLIGQRRHGGIPRRLIKHGAHFDFLVMWTGRRATGPAFRNFCQLIDEEIEASRALQRVLSTRRSRLSERYQTFHRPLLLK